jgi:uncharacterized protein YlzI (FlbEa/FlbD family)
MKATAASAVCIGGGGNDFSRDRLQRIGVSLSHFGQPQTEERTEDRTEDHPAVRSLYRICLSLPIGAGTGGSPTMIEVTRLNGNPMLVNSDLIKIAEASPDTMLTLIHGEKLIVRESCAEILEKVLAYRAMLLAAVAEHTKAPGDLHRLVALTTHNPDAYAPAAGAGKKGSISGPGLTSSLGASLGPSRVATEGKAPEPQR